MFICCTFTRKEHRGWCQDVFVHEYVIVFNSAPDSSLRQRIIKFSPNIQVVMSSLRISLLERLFETSKEALTSPSEKINLFIACSTKNKARSLCFKRYNSTKSLTLGEWRKCSMKVCEFSEPHTLTLFPLYHTKEMLLYHWRLSVLHSWYLSSRSVCLHTKKSYNFDIWFCCSKQLKFIRFEIQTLQLNC